MDLTRRKVLTLGALSAASAAMPLNAFAKIAAVPQQIIPFSPSTNEYDNLSRMTAADFKPWVGSVFDVYSDSSRSALVILDEVQDPPTVSKSRKDSSTKAKAAQSSIQSTSGPAIKAFALRFKSLSGDPLDQGTYVFENGALGRFALFIVPSAKEADPLYYTGLVSRLMS